MNHDRNRRAAPSLAVLLGCLLAASGRAADIYVAPDGNDTYPGSKLLPLRTLAAAAQTARSGDTCIVRRGFYHETLRPARSGKFDKPIQFVAAPGETVTLARTVPLDEWQVYSGAVYKAAASNVLQLLVDDVPAAPLQDMPGAAFEPQAVWWTAHDGFIYARFPNNDGPAARRVEIQRDRWSVDLSGLSHIVVKGFGIVAGGINLLDANHCRLEDCHLWWSEAGIRIGGKDNEMTGCSTVGGNAGVAFESNSMNNRMTDTLVRGGDRAGSNVFGVTASGTAQTIRRATVANWPGGAILCSNLLNGRVEYSEFRDVGQGTPAASVMKIAGDGKGTTISFNWLHDNHSPSGDGVLMDGSVENYILHHNVIWGQSRAALRLLGSCRYVFLCNNTCAMNGAAVDAGELAREAPLLGTRLVNNLFAGAVWPSSQGRPPAAVAVENNYVGDAPGFANATNRNFQLAPGSPCVDAGTDEPDFTEGYTGSAPDLGAYESGAAPWTPGCAAPEKANQVAKPVLHLILESATPEAEIRYTVDGRQPGADSTLYTGPVKAVSGTVRAKAFRGGMEDSPATAVTIRPAE